jgi:hypothetical protein
VIIRLICVALSLALALAKLTAAARAEAAAYERVLSAVTISFDPQAGEDRVLLISDEKNNADLYVYRGVDKSRGPMTPAFVKKDVTWNGPRGVGQRPSLAVSEKGSLLIRSGESFNNRREEQTLTVLYRDNDFYVVGVTRTAEGSYDSEYRKFSCDLNLLTGKGKANGKAVKFKAQPIKLTDWSDQAPPDDCNF